jgi:hypothetical protein
MFTPIGKPIHEDLATSYVLVDALVEDLCEGGFSGVVELALRESDARIIIDRGKVMAATQKAGDREPARTSVHELAALARRERGRLSVYGYESGIAAAMAERAEAAPLYTGLSTDFVDIEKMISKLARERDRRWFIEVTTEGGSSALISVTDDLCRVVLSADGATRSAEVPLGAADNSLLRHLIDECNSAGCVFDVYFKRADEAREIADPYAPQSQPGAAEASGSEDLGAEESLEASAELSSAQTAETESESAAQAAASASTFAKPFNAPLDQAPADEREAKGEAEGEAEALAEIKRLMSEIARTIEEAAQAVEQRAIFPMYLRTSQLKIADRYPFLDPFGAEFEYLAGEIAFIGKATPADFIAGLTEALSLAVVSVIQSSTQPARMRARVTEDLRKLSSRLGPELERFGLDRSIEQILNL